MKVAITIAIALGAVAGIGGRFVLRNDASAEDQMRQKALAYTPEQVAANGVIEGAHPEVALRPEVPGTVTVVHFRENQEVSKGDVLAELHNNSQKLQVQLAAAEVDLAQAQLERLKNGERPEKRKALAAIEEAKLAIYRHAKADSDRAEKLANKQGLSQEARDAAYYKMKQAQADLNQAAAERALVEAPAQADEVRAQEARVAAAKSRLQLAESELAKTKLVAPSSGRILHVYAEPGEMVGPNSAQPVLLLADVTKRRVRSFVEELDAARVEVGQKVTVTVDGVQGKEFSGKVAVVMPRMGKRSLQTDAPGEYKDVYFREVLVDLEGADHLPLNMRAQVRIQTKVKEEVR
jgi:multidrug resistance efflux pump